MRQVFHACDLHAQSPSTFTSETVRLPAARGFVVLETLDPVILQQAVQCTLQSARAEHHPLPAHLFDVLQDGIPVARLLGQAQ